MGDGFNAVGLGGGGAMYVPAISPHDPNLLFVACDMGGVYRSADGGASWTIFDKRQLRDCAGCPILFHPRNSAVLYAAPEGAFKTSADHGVTWSVLCDDPPWRGMPCTALEIDDDHSELMFAGTSEAAYRSVDGGRSWSGCNGVSGKIADIVSIAAHKMFLIATSEGVFRSTDRGVSWHRSDAGLPARAVRGLAAGPGSSSQQLIAYVTLANGIYRSTDGAKSWQLTAHVRIDLGSVAATDHRNKRREEEYDRIQTARCRAEIVYVTVRRPGRVTVYRSDDAAVSWRAVVNGEPGIGAGENITPGWIVEQHVWGDWNGALCGFGVSRRDPDQALFSNAGEIYRTTNGAATWTPVYSQTLGDIIPATARHSRTNGLDVTAAWQVAFDPCDPARVYICYSDIGLARSLDRGETWSHATRGMPWANTVSQIVFDPCVPGLIYAACSNQHGIPHWPDIESAHSTGGVCVSRDGGATWNPIGRGLPNAPATSIVLDPRSPVAARTLHVTQFGAGVYSSDDGGKTWRLNSAGLGGAENRHVYRLKLCADGTLYCTITGRREGIKFPVPGGLYRSRDGGRNWTEVTTELALLWPGDVDTAPDDSRIVYLGAASAPDYPQGGVYKSADDGKSWRCVLAEEEFPQALSSYAHALFVTVDPAWPDTIYCGATKHGLFVSYDAGESWQEVPGIPFTACQRVAFDPQDPAALWVATFGAGVWKGRARRSTQAVAV